jgi:hypothetical protein
MPAKEYPTAEYLRQCFDYQDGILYWRVRPREHFKDNRMWKAWNKKWSGKKAGCECWVSQKDGKGTKGKELRQVITLNSSHYYRSVLVYAYHKDEWHPKIDHKNGNTLDDRIEKLRPATSSQNGHNSTLMSSNTSGFRGVNINAYGNYQARITVNGKRESIGTFKTFEEAKSAYIAKSIEYFGEFSPYFKDK